MQKLPEVERLKYHRSFSGFFFIRRPQHRSRRLQNRKMLQPSKRLMNSRKGLRGKQLQSLPRNTKTN